MARTPAAALLCALGFGLGATAAFAHPPPQLATRELVRLQGHVGKKANQGVKQRVLVVALGVEYAFGATDWQVFGFSDAPPQSPRVAPPRLVLQGSRELLAAFASARADQTVTILAEHRPGSSDLFVLTLDLCPPR